MDEKCSYKTPTSADSLEQQIIDPSFPKNEREWWASEEITRLRAEVEALKAEDARLRKTWQKENDELVQILGKALQYPRFVDDQSVFPGATEADGVLRGAMSSRFGWRYPVSIGVNKQVLLTVDDFDRWCPEDEMPKGETT